MAALKALPVVVEVWGWDEAFAGAEVDEPWALAERMRATVAETTGLSCSIGIGETRQRAKIATGFAKPAGIYRIDAGTWMPIMGDRPTDALWGIGPRIARSLAELGIHTVAELAAVEEARLAERFGPTNGPRLKRLAEGGTVSPLVTTPRAPKSRGNQTTYPADLTDTDDIRAHLTVLAREVAEEVLGAGHTVTHVGVTVRTAGFWTRTRGMKLPAPTTDPADIPPAALTVLERFTITRPIRLLGVRLDLRD
jgi:DNA polymerase-4